MIIVQKRINLPTANMGSRPSKRKYNKEGHKQKLCKIGLSLGRNQLKVEGNFQFGYHSEIDKKYEAVDAKFLSQEEDINKKYEVDHAKHLPIIPEEGEENGRVPDTTVLQSSCFGGVERLYRDVKKEGKYDISRAQLKKWLMKQDTYTLHKQARRHYKRNRVIVGGIDELWQMDLADMQAHAKENDGYRYLLVCIDVFSKYVWVIPLKTKTGPALVTAFKKILESGRKPQKIQTDEGTEFFNKHFKDLMKSEEIQLYNTYNETKASVVERVIHTLKTRMWRYFTAKRTRRYIDVLQDLVDSYNKSKHRSIQKKPINVTQENEREVWHTLYGEREKKDPPKYKFEIGDQVRISKMKRTFEKGYLPNFSKEIFTVSQQIPRDPPVYKLKDYDQEELSGTFYNEELQKVIKEDDVYEVEKILKSRGKGKNKEVFVKWLGYPAKFNSWIPASEVKDI